MAASKIFKHPFSGGELFQCGFKEIPKNLSKFKCLVLSAKDCQPRIAGIKVVHAPIEDTATPDRFAYAKIIDYSNRASDEVATHLLRGDSVLVTCWAGLNRSGLISALAIKKILRCAGDEAVRIVKKGRGDHALSNPLFVDIILDF